jgi:hypothetical protein
MRGRKVLLIVGLTLIIFVGIASANEDMEDKINTINDIGDTIEVLDIINENNKDLDRLREDSTNETLLVENIEKTFKRSIEPLFGDIDDSEDVKNHFYWLIGITFVVVILGIIFPKLR